MSFVKHAGALLLAIFAWQVYQNNYARPQQQPRFSGFFHPTFRKVAETLRSNLLNGKERGASFSVYHKGELLVDVWGGWSDHDSERPWQEGTLSPFLSSTMGMAGIVVAKLFDMGVLDYKKELYHYWPEFNTVETMNITVEMLLSFQTGLIDLDEQISTLDYQYNWEKVEKLLATQSPKWPPGTAAGYHGMSAAMYADALLRKVDPEHRNMSQFFKEEIAKPLGIEFYIGLPKELYHRVARVTTAGVWEKRFSISELALFGLTPFIQTVNFLKDIQKLSAMNNPDLLAIGMPSVAGVGSTRDVAKMYDYLANGGSVQGQTLLSQAAVQTLTTPVTGDLRHLFIKSVRFSPGLWIRKNEQGHDIAGSPGFGGTNAFADLTSGVGIAYATNYLSQYLQDDPREVSLQEAFFECFEKFKAQKKAVK